MSVRPSVAVVGGGFGGTIFSVHLARSAKTPLRIDVIEPRSQVGSGVAYGAAGPEHRMNTLSANLTLFRDDPMHFERWLRSTGHYGDDPDALAGDLHHYARRRVFGTYMAELFAAEAKSNPSSSTLSHVRARVIEIDRGQEGLTLKLDNGQQKIYPFVVICASFEPPGWRWPSIGENDHFPGLVRDPWADGALSSIADRAKVLIIGTALTMADMVVSLRQQGHRGPITAISRHAMLPQPQLDFHEDYDFLAGEELPLTALALLRLTRQRARQAQSENMSWRAPVDGLRRAIGSIWQALPPMERAKAVRLLRPYWDTHRFRMAPQVAALLNSGRRDGWLTISAGRIVDVRRVVSQFEVEFSHQGSTTLQRADAVINCTGPATDLACSSNMAIRSLVRNGLARPDELRLGFDLDDQSRLVNAAGAPNLDIWAVGPRARPLFGEVVGVPQTASHARSVASLVAASSRLSLASASTV